jgi:uncharacterized protein
LGTFFKAVVLVLAIWVFSLVVRRALGRLRDSVGRGAQRNPPKEVADMVACAHCRLHVPRAEAFTRNGKYYCNADHARASGAQ